MMGTHRGSIDPGVLIYFMDEYKMRACAVEDIVCRQSGLLGVSRICSDMRSRRASADPTAAVAIEAVFYRIIRQIGSLAAAPGGFDGLICTALPATRFHDLLIAHIPRAASAI
jgi:acetate kinase